MACPNQATLLPKTATNCGQKRQQIVTISGNNLLPFPATICCLVWTGLYNTDVLCTSGASERVSQADVVIHSTLRDGLDDARNQASSSQFVALDEAAKATGEPRLVDRV